MIILWLHILFQLQVGRSDQEDPRFPRELVPGQGHFPVQVHQQSLVVVILVISVVGE